MQQFNRLNENTMKSFILPLALFMGTITLSACGGRSVSHEATTADVAAETVAVTRVIENYFTALNASDAATLVALFAPDGEVLPPNAPTAQGTEQVLSTYQYVFSTFDLDLKVTVGKVLILGDYAVAMSVSSGKMTVNASGETTEGNNFRETFILRKINGRWLIARYMYNTPQ